MKTDDEMKDRIEFAVIMDKDCDPDSWWVRSDRYRCRVLSDREAAPLRHGGRGVMNERFFLLPEDRQFNFHDKGVRAVYLIRYVANVAFAPW